MNYSNFADDSETPARQANGFMQQLGGDNFSSFSGRGSGGDGGGNTGAAATAAVAAAAAAPEAPAPVMAAMPRPLLGGGGGGRPGPTMKEITIDPDNLVIFHGRNNALSTFYEAPVLMVS